MRTWSHTIDQFLADWRMEGRIVQRSEADYFKALCWLEEDSKRTDPTYADRDDVKHCLTRWQNPNSARKYRSIFVTFFDWMMEEGLRLDNPARQTRRPKPRPTNVYHPTRDEAQRMLKAAEFGRERRCIYLGLCAGLRNQELRGLQGRHFRRPGFVWVSEDIAKGGKERYVPVIPDLEPIAASLTTMAEDDYALCSQRWRDPGVNREPMDYSKRPCSAQAVYYLVKRVAKRAGIGGNVTPHSMRRAFTDMVEAGAGMRMAQLSLGHSSISTTEGYLSKQPQLDVLATAFAGLTFGLAPDATRLSETALVSVGEAPTRIELVSEEIRLVEPVSALPEPDFEQIARLIGAMRAALNVRRAA